MVTYAKTHREFAISAAKLICTAIFIVALFVLAGCVAKNRVGASSNLQTITEITEEQNFDESERYGLALDHFVLARDYERRGMQDMAEQLYKTAYDFWPKSNHLRKELTERYMRVEAYNKALELFFREDKPLPNLTSEDRRTISLIYLRLGDVQKATEMIESLDSEMSEEEMYSLALLYSSVGQKDMALRNFKKFFGASKQSVSMGIKLAQINIGDRNFADAESLAVILHGAYPDNADVISLLGTVKYLNRDTLAAIRRFSEALELDSINEEALRTLAHIHIVRDEFDEAVSYYRRLIAQKDVGEPYRRGLAFLLFHLKEFNEAEKLLDTLVLQPESKDLPGMHELRSYRGLIYIQTKRYDKAAAEFKTAIALDSLYEDAYRELCYSYILAKDNENARIAADKYVATFPKSADAWRQKGHVSDMRKEYDMAAAAFKKAVEIDPSDYFAWFHLGSVLERQKRINEAADAFKVVLKLRPNDAEAANYLGYMWAEAGIMLDSAKFLIETALTREPLNGAYLDSYAWVFYRMGDYEKALFYMNKALEQENMKDDPIPYEHLGDIFFKMDDYDKAAAAYKRSIELKSEETKRIKERLSEIKNILRNKKSR